jgi:hypothetical protein
MVYNSFDKNDKGAGYMDSIDYKLFLARDGFRGTDVVIVPLTASESLREVQEYITDTVGAGYFADAGEAYKSIITDGLNAIAASSPTEATQQPIEVQIDPLEAETLKRLAEGTGATWSDTLIQAMQEGVRVQRNMGGK